MLSPLPGPGLQAMLRDLEPRPRELAGGSSRTAAAAPPGAFLSEAWLAQVCVLLLAFGLAMLVARLAVAA